MGVWFQKATSVQPPVRRLVAHIRDAIGPRPVVRNQGRDNLVHIHPSARLRDVRVHFVGNANTLFIEDGCRLNHTTVCFMGDRQSVRIGRRVKVTQGTEIVLHDDESSISIGNHTTIESCRLVSLEGSAIELGDDCMLAYGIEIRNGDSHSIIDAASRQRINPSARIQIADHVWLCAHTTVLKGSLIERDSIVGLGAVVSGNFEAGVILGGTPARVVRRGVTWDRKRL